MSKGANRIILHIFWDMKHLNFGWAPYRNLHGAGIWKNSRGGGQKVNFFSKKKLCSEMIPKGFPHHPNHFSAKIGPITPRFEPILWHVWWNLAVFWLYHAPKTAFSSRKKIDPKRHPKTCKRLPTSSKSCNALSLIIFSRRFTHVSLGYSHAHVYFGWATTWICMGPDLEIIWEVKKSKKNRFFHYYSTNWFEKASHVIYITFFAENRSILPPLEPILRPA